MYNLRLDTGQVKSLSFGARSTYYSALYLASSKSRSIDKDIKLFDVVPSSTYYRHRKEIIEKTGLDLNDFFPSSAPDFTSGIFISSSHPR